MSEELKQTILKKISEIIDNTDADKIDISIYIYNSDYPIIDYVAERYRVP